MGALYSDRTFKEAMPPFRKDFKTEHPSGITPFLQIPQGTRHQSCSEHVSLAAVEHVSLAAAGYGPQFT